MNPRPRSLKTPMPRRVDGDEIFFEGQRKTFDKIGLTDEMFDYLVRTKLGKDPEEYKRRAMSWKNHVPTPGKPK